MRRRPHLGLTCLDRWRELGAVNGCSPCRRKTRAMAHDNGRKLVFQLTGAFAEFERTMIRQRIKAGLKRAVAPGREARPAEDRWRDRTEGAKAACERRGHLEGGEVARARDWHGPSHLKRAWLKALTAILPLSPSFLCVAPRVGGLFGFKFSSRGTLAGH